MKKFMVVFMALMMLLFATSTKPFKSPFEDVPLNHWTYNAMDYLASHGLPCLFHGGREYGSIVTRYEMASTLARIIQAVDMTRVNKQFIKTLRKLVVEFEDELVALGVNLKKCNKTRLSRSIKNEILLLQGTRIGVYAL